MTPKIDESGEFEQADEATLGRMAGLVSTIRKAQVMKADISKDEKAAKADLLPLLQQYGPYEGITATAHISEGRTSKGYTREDVDETLIRLNNLAHDVQEAVEEADAAKGWFEDEEREALILTDVPEGTPQLDDVRVDVYKMRVKQVLAAVYALEAVQEDLQDLARLLGKARYSSPGDPYVTVKAVK